ncbi:serine/threonine-protein kinase [Streptomyces sp. NPDC093970]|uniref:serine/threonine-protein kinase n=1 Tax=Streptomyces sp. NPDC093970 TaxID=3155076 RepID=UPI00344465B5
MGTDGEAVRLVAGRYRLEARLGRGGMGVVWRATDQLLGRRVAVKELTVDDSLPDDDARLRRDRTLREAQAVAQLHHPHIIVVHDVVEEGERPYIVMELVVGGSLADLISRNGPVDAGEAARIGIALLSALRTAHTAGVLHRDIKPANVLVETATGRVVLTDFGIAQVAGATTLTETGSFVGSPEYTAPERMSGSRSGPASDLWSLGVLLCAALSGESPFRRDSLGGILHAVVSDEIRPPAQAEPLLPVVRGLLERDPERRLGAAEAERMLRAFLETGTVAAARAAEGVGVSAYTPTQRDVPRPPAPAPAGPPRSSPRGLLVAALLVAAMAGAGVSAAALLFHGGGGGGTPAPGATATAATTRPTATTPSPSPPSSPSPPPSPSPSAANSRSVPSGYRLARDPGGFSLAVPEDFTRDPQGQRVFYLSSGQAFRLGIKVSEPQTGGPGLAMRRAAAAGPSTNPGYHDGRVSDTTHSGHPAAFWEFTWNGFSASEGPRHTFDLCWEEGGRMYDVWVSAPVGKVREAREYFDVAVDTFAARR